MGQPKKKRKPEYRTTVSSSKPTPGHIPRQNYNSKRYRDPCVPCSPIHNSQDMETTSMAMIVEWIKKMCCLYTREYYSAIKKDKIMPLKTTRLQLEILIRSESEKDKYHMISFKCGI